VHDSFSGSGFLTRMRPMEGKAKLRTSAKLHPAIFKNASGRPFGQLRAASSLVMMRGHCNE
jgi:hypothetical protein